MSNIKSVANHGLQVPDERHNIFFGGWTPFSEKGVQRGVSVLFVVLIMGMILAISLGISSILGKQTESLRNIGYSVIAFYAADTGVENVLKEEDPLVLHGYEETLDNGAQYTLNVRDKDHPQCDSANFCIKSVGTYEGVKRAIEINY